MTGKGCERTSWGAGNVLFHDCIFFTQIHFTVLNDAFSPLKGKVQNSVNYVSFMIKKERNLPISA